MSKHFFQNETLRLVLLRTYRFYARSMFWRRGPKVFINSIPKAGTHLATAIIEEVPGLMQSRLHIDMWDVHAGEEKLVPVPVFTPDVLKLRNLLATVRPGQIATGHLPWHPDLHQVLTDMGFNIIFVIRDPEDVVMSTFHYVKGLRRHFMYQRLMTDYATDAERIEAVRRGIPARFPGDTSLEGTYDLRARFLGWQNVTGWGAPLVLEFENIVGKRGGGSHDARRRSIDQIIRFVGMEPSKSLIDEIDARSINKKSFTFRGGKIGEGRQSGGAIG
jgi:Sulfotransferase domain.